MESLNGFQTNVWGPMMWTFLHMSTLNYNPSRKKEYMIFFKSLSSILPCGACRTNYKNIITGKEYKTKLSNDKFKSRESISLWLFYLHNAVQREIYKKTHNKFDQPKYTDSKKDFKIAMSTYELFRAKCSEKSYGCTIPEKGGRKRAEIHIKKRARYPTCRKDSIVIHNNCK